MPPTLSGYAALVGRLVFAAMFAMALSFKLMGIQATATFIAAAGFPAPLLLAILAALFETGLVIAFLTGILFWQASLAAMAYVLFLGFAFHGPGHWKANQDEFGFFVDHFCFAAGLLFAAANGPGDKLVWRRSRKAVAA